MVNQFKAGDVVQLKSGGPKMTVTEIELFNGKPVVYCSWFVGTKQEKSDFTPEALKFPETPPAPPQARPFDPGGEY
jgi:uncharacterized protein YodC (DUF2158 family)